MYRINVTGSSSCNRIQPFIQGTSGELESNVQRKSGPGDLCHLFDKLPPYIDTFAQR